MDTSKKKEIFADRLERVHVVGEMFRLDFGTAQPSQDGTEPVLETKYRLILPPEGFLAMVATLEDVAKKLMARGLIKPKAGAAPQEDNGWGGDLNNPPATDDGWGANEN